MPITSTRPTSTPITSTRPTRLQRTQKLTSRAQPARSRVLEADMQASSSTRQRLHLRLQVLDPTRSIRRAHPAHPGHRLRANPGHRRRASVTRVHKRRGRSHPSPRPSGNMQARVRFTIAIGRQIHSSAVLLLSVVCSIHCQLKIVSIMHVADSSRICLEYQAATKT